MSQETTSPTNVQEMEIIEAASPEYDTISKHDDLMSPLSEGEHYSEPSPSPPSPNEIPLVKSFKPANVRHFERLSSSLSLSQSDGEMSDTPPLNKLTKHRQTNTLYIQNNDDISDNINNNNNNNNNINDDDDDDDDNNDATSNLSTNNSPIEAIDIVYEHKIPSDDTTQTDSNTAPLVRSGSLAESSERELTLEEKKSLLERRTRKELREREKAQQASLPKKYKMIDTPPIEFSTKTHVSSRHTRAGAKQDGIVKANQHYFSYRHTADDSILDHKGYNYKSHYKRSPTPPRHRSSKRQLHYSPDKKRPYLHIAGKGKIKSHSDRYRSESPIHVIRSRDNTPNKFIASHKTSKSNKRLRNSLLTDPPSPEIHAKRHTTDVPTTTDPTTTTTVNNSYASRQERVKKFKKYFINKVSPQLSKFQEISDDHDSDRTPSPLVPPEHSDNNNNDDEYLSRYSPPRSRSSTPSISPKQKLQHQPAPVSPDLSLPLNHLPDYMPAVYGCRTIEQYEILNRIDEGTFGVVYRARDKRTNEIVALKKLKMEKEKEGFPVTSFREINTLLKAKHENVIHVKEIVVGSNMNKIYMVMDFMEHDLKSLMETMNQPFLEGEVKTLMLQLLNGLAHLHDNWILHRDIKTSNLLLNHRGRLRIGDFGLAREYGSPLKRYTGLVVTLWYRAPELLLGAEQYSTPIDLWSAGCVFSELLTKKPLFPGKGEIDLITRIFKLLGTPSEDIWPGYNNLSSVKKTKFAIYPYNTIKKCLPQLSKPGIDLINKFLRYYPVARITAKDAIGDPYFTSIPLPIPSEGFPTWPAKSEVVRGAVGASKHSPVRSKLNASPTAPLGGGTILLNNKDDDIDSGSSGFRLHSAQNADAERGFNTRVK